MKIEKCSVLILVFLMLFIAVAPVFAESPKKVPVSLYVNVKKALDTDPVKVWTSDDGIIHKQGIIRTVAIGTSPAYNVVLSIEGQEPIRGGTIYAVVDLMENTKTGLLTNHYHPWIVAFEGGTFEGVNTWTWDKIPLLPLNFDGHAVLHGTGVFEGQKLSIQMDTATTWSGYLLIP